MQESRQGAAQPALAHQRQRRDRQSDGEDEQHQFRHNGPPEDWGDARGPMRSAAGRHCCEWRRSSDCAQ
jgi:hypothetical protein